MTEFDWNSCTDPQQLLELLRKTGRASKRKLRLFACACCRSIWEHLSDERSRKAVEVAEQFADGLATNNQLLTAMEAAYAYASRLQEGRWAAYAAWNAANDQGGALGAAASTAWNASPEEMPTGGTERGKQYWLLCCIIGSASPPTAAIEPAWLSWNNDTVRRLAEAAYQDRLLPTGTLDAGQLAVLADALEEAGCHDEEILSHLRQQGAFHYRGCWVIDLLLNKN